MKTFSASASRRVELERQIEQDQDAHVKDDFSFNKIIDGKLVPCAWDDLTEDEKRACFANLFRLY